MHLFLVKGKRKTNNKILKKSKQNSVRKAALETNLKNGNEKHNDNYNNYSHLDIYMFPYSPHF